MGRVFYEDPEDCEFFLKQRFLEDFHENFLAKLLYAVLDFGSFLWLIWIITKLFLTMKEVINDITSGKGEGT